ncbi:phosphoglycerate kinase [Candidatus Wolfebacteria bacterium RIFCSPLOWO2_01_FULL_45_19]|uniref:Phosphoglycerate kinase n=1 Tax=Candidatus Wolfebacteria bacterium RIFCSPLOWO2_01_FULL_45_19 TaxID=1802557 RepID=A0A1F8DS25_9BACT|nr:MAG: phosphoglycerate kinase [Candidatus Wolfebacteria bacterium RIFCSPLOWO2_01_FULL_45_19]
MIRYLSKASTKTLRGTALLRLDFNAPDGWRIEAALPTVKFLLRYADKIVILSHRGRPKGYDKELSLEKDALQFKRMLGKKERDKVIVLENLRFLAGESKNDVRFAKKLASLGDYYVNDAFAVSHRANASVAAIAKFLPAYAGFGLENEIKNLTDVMQKPRRPLIVILGGVKISDKLGVVSYFKKKAAFFLVGGALANTLLFSRGINVGDSLREKNSSREVRVLAKSRKIILPSDFRWNGRKIFDIGPRSEQEFKQYIAGAGTIIWNGPMGVFEKKEFSNGTKAVWKAILANRKAKIVVGGGETISALKRFKIYDLRFKNRRNVFISTGGGAMLEFLAGKKLPGIIALNKK